MDLPSLSPHQQSAVRTAFAYWLPRWDWEMPTLTGLSLEEFRRAAESWPNLLPEAPKMSMLAALGAVRELWAGERDAPELLGISADEVLPLIQILAKGVDDAV